MELAFCIQLFISGAPSPGVDLACFRARRKRMAFQEARDIVSLWYQFIYTSIESSGDLLQQGLFIVIDGQGLCDPTNN